MELLVLRHGTAEDYAPSGGDPARRLVEKGYRQAERAGRLMKDLDRLPDIVLTSPYVRARQTAEIFCEAAGIGAPVVQDWLASGMRAETGLSELRAFSQYERVMIVGHEPDLSGLLEAALGAMGGTVEMKKGALACVEITPPRSRGRLLFLVPPKLIG